MPAARKKPKPKPKAKPKVKAKAKPKRARAVKPTKRVAKPATRNEDGIPQPIADDVFSSSGKRRARTAREWSTRSSPVVEILDDPHPIGALRRFLDSIKGPASEQQTQIALGSAQLLLLPIARESRGGPEVKELVDLVL